MNAKNNQILTLTLEDFMWENHFKSEFEKIPHRRRDAVSVIKFKNLIRDMYMAGYNLSQIGRYTGRDHTTIVYHVQDMFNVANLPKELKKSLKPLRPPRHYLDEAVILERERIKKEQREKRLAASKIKQQIKVEKEQAKVKLREEVAKLREKVFQMYKDGKSYDEIRTRFNIPRARIQALLIYHPLYRTVIRPRWQAHGRPVVQFTKDGKRIAEFNTCTAAAKAAGLFRNNISMVAKGRIPSAGGYVWKYKDEL